jgi:trimethylamine--corrinoid protein Co-methyltransferase
MAHFRERWYPDVFERGNYDQWQGAGGQSLGERAAARVEKILHEHKPVPLPEDVARDVHAVVQHAEAQFS